MRYMMRMYSQETPEGPSPEEVESLIRTRTKIAADARRKGVLVAVEGLKPAATAATVRSGSGAGSIFLDGPFAETKEQFVSYYILDCRDVTTPTNGRSEFRHRATPRAAATFRKIAKSRPFIRRQGLENQSFRVGVGIAMQWGRSVNHVATPTKLVGEKRCSGSPGTRTGRSSLR